MKYREPEERIPRINRVKEGWGEGGCAGDGRDRRCQTKMGSGSDENTQRPPFFINFNTYPVKLSHLNFHPLEAVSRNLKRVKITLFCLIWDQTFENTDVYYVYTLISFPICD